MFISKGCLITILDNLSMLNKETEELKKKVADLEGQVQGQQKEIANVLKCVNSRPVILSCQGQSGGSGYNIMDYPGGKG